jgi:hypothetical protein
MHLAVQEDNIKLYLTEIRCEDVDWIYLAQDKISGGLILNMVIVYGSIE